MLFSFRPLVFRILTVVIGFLGSTQIVFNGGNIYNDSASPIKKANGYCFEIALTYVPVTTS
ncbi:MAG: hypothetical protein NPIRA06_15060 [Nitrospirales bacterium]|nr:MAG: hypothetical protein NPIRA06_15060 [Nitrospirales bacterium]